jgi:hypothetical protein
MIMKLTSLLLALSIFMQPLGPSIALAEDPSPITNGSCEGKAGWAIDPVSGDCKMTAETIAARDAARECENLSGQAQRDCHERVAREGVDKVKSEEEEKLKTGFFQGGSGRSLVPLVMTTVAGYYMLKNKNGIKCSALSMKLLMGAGIAGITGEAIAYFGHKSRTKKAAEEYQDNVNSHDPETDETNYENMDNNQVLAFDYLIKLEESSLKSEKVRKTAHLVATGLYAAAVVAGVVEAIKDGVSMGTTSVSSKCTVTSTGSTNSSPSPSTNISFQHVQENKLYTSQLNANSFSEQIRSLSLIDKRFDHLNNIPNITSDEVEESVLRIIYSNLLPTLHAQTTQPQQKQQKSKSGGFLSIITGILPMLATFFKGGGGSASGGGSAAGVATTTKVVKPEFSKQTDVISKALSWPVTRIAMGVTFGAYSYTVYKRAKENADQLEKRIEAIKQIKSDFVNSGGTEGVKLCEGKNCLAEKYKGNDYNWDQTNGLLAESQSGCVNKQDKLDLECKCLRKKTKSGQNNCSNFSGNFKINTGAISSFANPFTQGYDAVASGGLSQGTFNDGSFENKVLAIRKKIDDLKGNKKYSDVFKKADKISGQLMKGHENFVNKSFPNGISSSDMGLGTPKLANSKLEDIVNNAKKKIAKNKGPTFKRGKDAKGKKDNDDFNLDFGSDTGEEIKIDDVASVMDKEYEIKGDINNNPSQDIFKILSLRYQRSALRRLFDESGKSSVDEASGSQINGI